MGFPGIVDTWSGTIHCTLRKYDDAPRQNLAARFQRSFGLPFRIENDARMALLGEHEAGAARGCGNVVMMILGTGIGTAAMIKGQLLRGAHGQQEFLVATCRSILPDTNACAAIWDAPRVRLPALPCRRLRGPVRLLLQFAVVQAQDRFWNSFHCRHQGRRCCPRRSVTTASMCGP